MYVCHLSVLDPQPYAFPAVMPPRFMHITFHDRDIHHLIFYLCALSLSCEHMTQIVLPR